jgi:tRNA isopentenyl-2-thiomethyl-A-37 hydroxylase MiaE
VPKRNAASNFTEVFTNAQLAGLYTQLVMQGQKSLLDALQVGAFIEETDIADLQKAIAGTIHMDIANIYENLMKGSRNHLRAFVGQIESQGVAYTAQALPQAEVDAIVNSPNERGNANGGGGRWR